MASRPMAGPEWGLRLVVRIALVTKVAALAVCCGLLAGCSGGGGVRRESTKLGPRIVPIGQPAPKGGGVPKLGSAYMINGQVYQPRAVSQYTRVGIASWYGELFHGRRTANGEIYDMEALTAAHPTLPLPSYARVTNMRNGRSMVLRINDRGPYAKDREIDLSWASASLLGIAVAGTGLVQVDYLGPAPLDGNDRHERQVLASQPWAGARIAYAPSPARAYSAAASRLSLYRTAPTSGPYE